MGWPESVMLEFIGACEQRARIAGLVIPRYTLQLVAGLPGEKGHARRAADGTLTLSIRTDLGAQDTRRTIVHELAHLADYGAGLDRELSDEQMEARADAFVAKVEAQALLEFRRGGRTAW